MRSHLNFLRNTSLVIAVATVSAASVFGNAASAETLQEALITAYNSNPRLMAERARVREVDENYIQARAQGRLTSTASGSLGYAAVRLPGTNFLGQADGSFQTSGTEPSTVQLNVIQPIYQGGRVRALKAQAKAGVLAARENLRNAEQNLFLSVATSYSDVLRDEEAARIRRNNVRVLTRQTQAATDRFDVGEGTRTDIAQARTRLAAADIGLAQADAQLQISRASYTRLVGYPPLQLKPLPNFVMPATLGEAIAIGRDNNPQLIGAMLNEKAALASVDVAKSASKPTISLNGNAASTRRQISGISRAETASITAQISIPIFAGGLNRSRVRAAKEVRTRLMFEVRDTERALDQAIKQIWAQLDAAKRSLVASRTQVESAEFSFEGVQLEQQVGTRSALDVLNAEQELLDAKLSLINAGAAVQEAEFQLLTTVGAFDAISIQLPVDNYDPEKNFAAVKYLGMHEAIDTYIPIAARKIGRQLPNIPKDIAKVAVDAIEVTTIPSAVEKIGTQSLEIPKDMVVFSKKAIDKITGQEEKPQPNE